MADSTKVTVDLGSLDLPTRLLVQAATGQADEVVALFAEWRKKVDALDEQARQEKASYSTTRKLVTNGRADLEKRVHNFFEGRGRPAGATNKPKEETPQAS
jgi:hypothetical protein